MIELPKSYRMNVLVLKIITLNSNYVLSKIAIKIREIPMLHSWPRVQRQKFVNLALSKVLDLNKPCDRAS